MYYEDFPTESALASTGYSPHQKWHSVLPPTRNTTISYLIFSLRKRAYRGGDCRNVFPSPGQEVMQHFQEYIIHFSL